MVSYISRRYPDGLVRIGSAEDLQDGEENVDHVQIEIERSENVLFRGNGVPVIT